MPGKKKKKNLLNSCSSRIFFFFFFFFFFFSLLLASTTTLPIPPFTGISPHEKKYFEESDVISCKDGSKSFSRDRLNDGFCDCVDGTDEPGTSACPESKFYCRNLGSTPQLLFSSRVNDRICDCCDGSDEYDGSINCPSTCIINNGDVLEKIDEDSSTKTSSHVINVHERNNRNKMQDLIQKLQEFKILVIVEMVLVSFIMTFGLFRRRIRFRRRQH